MEPLPKRETREGRLLRKGNSILFGELKSVKAIEALSIHYPESPQRNKTQPVGKLAAVLTGRDFCKLIANKLLRVWMMNLVTFPPVG